MNPDRHDLYDTLLLINGVVLDLGGDTATGPHLDSAWIPAFAGMTVGAELAYVPPRLWPWQVGEPLRPFESEHLPVNATASRCRAYLL
jgi:hypothetical protein